MSQDKIDILERALKREKAARKAAEKILEQKSTDLYYSNKKLEKLYADLESELTRTDSQLQGVFENIVDAYVIIDLSGDILKMNSAAVKLLEFESGQQDDNLMNMVFPEDYEVVTKSFKSLIKDGSITNFEIKIKTKQNKIKLVHINASIIYDKGIPVAAQGIVRDITKSKEDELVVQLINNIAQSILGKLDIYEIAFEITDKIANYLDSNDCVIYLYHEESHTLEQIAAYGEKLDKHNRLVNKIILKEGQGVVGHVAKTGIAEIVNNTNQDSRYVVDIIERKSEITVPIKIGNKVIGVIDSENENENFFTQKHLEMLNNIASLVALQLKSAVDLRDRQKAEEELKESEERLSTLILNLDSGVLLEDENRKIVLTNKRFCDFFEIPVSPEQLIGQDCSSSAEESKWLFENPEKFVKTIDSILTKREVVLGEELTMVSGKIYERDYIPIFRNGDYKGHLWKYRDVTLRRKYRKSIEAQRQKYRSIITNMNLGLLEVNINDEILMVNQSFEEMSGYTSSELLGKVARDIFTVDTDAEIIQKENLERQKGHFNSYELKVKNKRGELRHWLISGAPNYNLNGEVIGSIGIHLDITDLKSLQLQKEILLKDLEKSNDELHEYAHVVSHDLKSPLRSINALVSWLKEDNKGRLDDTSLRNFSLIESTLEKMEQLISNILNYSSLDAESTERESVDLNDVLSDLAQILFIPDHINLKIAKPLPTLQGDKTKLQQLFQNLIGNAIKFCDKKEGLIEVDFEDMETHYQFHVKDNGMGIEKRYHEKIFKIFNYLNKSKDSSGIGLSIVKKIVDLHEGKIWLESELNIGTTFYFTLKK
jgi:PAS domain S-box-containing protein